MMKLNTVVKSLSLVLWVWGGAVGCGGSSEFGPGPDCTGGKCDSYKIEPIAPTPLLSLWIEREDMGSGLGFINNIKCQNVSSTDSVGPRSIEINGGGALTEIPTSIASFTDNYYPRKQQVDITLDGLNVWSFLGGWNLGFWFEASSKYSFPTISDPLILKRPFWIWPVTIIAKNKMFAGQAQSYQIDIDPFFPSIGGSGSSSYKVEGMMTVVAEGKYQTIYFPVEKNTSFVKMQTDVLGSSNKSFNITGPGYYLAENGTMRVATADEIKKALETCEEGKKRCNASSQTVEVCTNGQWQAQVDCTQSSKSCVNGECVSAPTCEEGKVRCQLGNSTVESCLQGQWAVAKDCSLEGKSCQDGECVDISASCAPICADRQVCVQGDCLMKSCQLQESPCTLDSDCANDKYICFNGSCLYSLGEYNGAPCQMDSQCKSADYVCIENTCRNLKAQNLGATCVDTGDCDPNKFECQGGSCSYTGCSVSCNNSQVCVDNACKNRSDQGSDKLCYYDGQCKDNFVCVNNLCKERYYQGTDKPCSCDGQCKDNFVCVNNLCKERYYQGADKPCNYDGQCKDNFICVNDLCKERYYQGTDKPCNYDGQCKDNFVCVNSLCKERYYQDAGDPCCHDQDCRSGYVCDPAKLTCK